MFLLYVDESGNPKRDDEPFVLAGVAVHEAALNELRKQLRGTAARHLEPPLRGIELHAGHIRAGKGPWRGVPKKVRRELLEGLARNLGRCREIQRAPCALFGVVAEPGVAPNQAPQDRVVRAFEELFTRFDAFVEGTPLPEPLTGTSSATRHGMVVADKSRYESTLQPLTTIWRTRGNRIRRLRSLCEVPLFCDSEASLLVQAADLVAYALWRGYARDDEGLLDLLAPGFDQRDGRLHGLFHYVRQYRRCPCRACRARR